MATSIYHLLHSSHSVGVDAGKAKQLAQLVYNVENPLDLDGQAFELEVFKAYQQAKADGSNSPLTLYIKSVLDI